MSNETMYRASASHIGWTRWCPSAEQAWERLALLVDGIGPMPGTVSGDAHDNSGVQGIRECGMVYMESQ